MGEERENGGEGRFRVAFGGERGDSGWMTKKTKSWLFRVARCAAAAAAGAQGVEIRDVKVKAIGGVPVGAAQVLSRVRARPGMELDRGEISADVRRLQESGAFSYVESRLENSPDGGADLVFHVAGRPRIRRLEITGAEHLSNKKVGKLMEISSGDRVDGALLGAKAQAVRDKYRKDFYPETRVTWTLTPCEDDPAMADVEIRVEEGERKLVRKIVFTGKKHISDRDLRAVMVQKQSSWLTFFNNDGEYLAGALLADKDTALRVSDYDR